MRPDVSLVARILHLLLISPCLSSQDSASTPADRLVVPILSGAATCASTTINYITHSLPQQCLTIRPSKAAAATDEPHAQSTTVDQPADAADSNTESNLDGAPYTTMPSFEDWRELTPRYARRKDLPVASRHWADHGSRPHQDSRHAELDFAMDSIGDDVEISLNLNAYNTDEPEMARQETTFAPGTGRDKTDNPDLSENQLGDDLFYDDGRTRYYRSKDAGETCKERFSYSSFDAGATVVKTSRGAKNSKAILVENKDTYMLLECAEENKYAIIELSDDILVDTVVLANFEFFSSMIRHFRVSVSDRYPVKTDKWRDLGTFEAKNSRDIQAFLVQNPQIWAKYVRIEFLSHFGNEYYCPISLVRVHGTRMIESWQDVEGSHDDEANEEEEKDNDEDFATSQTRHDQEGEEQETDDNHAEPVSYGEYVDANSVAIEDGPAKQSHLKKSTHGNYAEEGFCIPDNPLQASLYEDTNMCSSSLNPSARLDLPLPSSYHDASTGATPQMAVPVGLHDGGRNRASIDGSASSLEMPPSTPVVSPVPDTSSSGSTVRLTMKETLVTSPNSLPQDEGPQTSISSKGKSSTGTAGAPFASPTVQESFFKSVTKRLQLLESNMTLSLKYLEDQSKHLNDVLQSSERRQMLRIESFIREMNQSLVGELGSLRQQYDEVWQATVIALDSQREQSEQEIVALSTRLNLLADEVIFQKRMAITQAVLLLTSLVLVIFTRGSAVSQAPFPLLTQRNLLGQQSQCPTPPRSLFAQAHNCSDTDGCQDPPQYQSSCLPDSELLHREDLQMRHVDFQQGGGGDIARKSTDLPCISKEMHRDNQHPGP